MSRDMGNGTIRELGLVVVVTLAGVQSPSGHHRCRRRGSFARLRWLAPTACRRGGCPSSWPATGPRATPRSSLARGAPRHHRRRSPQSTVELIVELRRQLVAQGLDAGADTIGWHLEHHHHLRVSRATIDRTLRRHGLVTPAPQKRPRSSYVRFAAEQPNEMWQADFTHYRLTTGADTEILSWLDDHARYALSVTAHRRVTGPIVVDTFRAAIAQHGPPASTLTDNGMVFTTRLAGGTRWPQRASRPNCAASASSRRTRRPNHPTTCGKVERFQQTLKMWLRAQPDQPATIAELQALLDVFVDIYNHQRPHRSLPRRVHPRRRLHRPTQSHPRRPQRDTHYRVRHDRVDNDRQRHPAPRTADSTTSASATNTPEPASSCSSPTSTSASSTPPPASSSATSPSTPPATTSPRPTTRPTTPKTTTARTPDEVRTVSDVLRHHTVRRQDSNLRPSD